MNNILKKASIRLKCSHEWVDTLTWISFHKVAHKRPRFDILIGTDLAYFNRSLQEVSADPKLRALLSLCGPHWDQLMASPNASSSSTIVRIKVAKRCSNELNERIRYLWSLMQLESLSQDRRNIPPNSVYRINWLWTSRDVWYGIIGRIFYINFWYENAQLRKKSFNYFINLRMKRNAAR